MKYEERIMTLFNNGYLRTSLVVKENIPKVYLTKLVKLGKIERVSRGLYTNKKEITDELLILQNKSKYAIYSNMTALYFLGFSNRLPIKYDITVPNGYKGTLQNNSKVNLYYIKKEYSNIGIITIKDNYNNDIRIYDLEKSMCDIIRNKNRTDRELFNKAIRDYYYSKNKNTLKLYNYAKKMNIYNKVKNTFEVFS